MKIEVTQADMECARDIRNAWDVSCDTAFEIAAKHRTTRTDATPVAWSDDEAFKQMHLLYNYADDDSRQFTRWQMSTAMAHGVGLAVPHPPATDVAALVEENARLRQALEDVANPMSMIQRQAEAEGNQLSGMAYSIANDLGFVQTIAKRALAPFTKDKS